MLELSKHAQALPNNRTDNECIHDCVKPVFFECIGFFFFLGGGGGVTYMMGLQTSTVWIKQTLSTPVRVQGGVELK